MLDGEAPGERLGTRPLPRAHAMRSDIAFRIELPRLGASGGGVASRGTLHNREAAAVDINEEGQSRCVLAHHPDRRLHLTRLPCDLSFARLNQHGANITKA